MKEIVFTQELFSTCFNHLLQDKTKENMVYAIAGVNKTSEGVRLLVKELFPAGSDDLDGQSGAHLNPKRDFVKMVLKRCLKEGLSFIEMHSHPFVKGGVAFSSIDWANEERLMPYVAERIPKIWHAALVFGQSSICGYLWDRREKKIAPLDRIRLVGCPLQFIPLGQGRKEKEGSEREEWNELYSRQIAAFGKGSQERLKELKVGIVGLGGTGSIVNQALAHLGVGHLILIDPDVVERSNLNRLVGATHKDVILKRAKVSVAKRVARAVNPRIKVTALKRSIFEEQAMKRLKEVDIIFGCTDSNITRVLLNQLSIQYLIPYIDLGSGIETNENKDINLVCAQARTVIPGEWCLSCINGLKYEEAAKELIDPEVLKDLREQNYGIGKEGFAPQVIWLNAVVSNLAIAEFMNMISPSPFKKPAPYVFYNALKPELLIVPRKRREDCAFCGVEGIIGLGDVEPLPKFERERKIPINIKVVGDCNGRNTNK